MAIDDVLSGRSAWHIEQADCLEFLRQLPDDSVDMIFSSPPYEKARLYLESGEDLGIARDTEEWVAWMVSVYRECLRVCTGLVAFVVQGQTKDFRYSCAPQLLMADLCRAGVTLRNPPVFHRIGIPGSGGPDWLRADCETIICATRGGELPWSENTACGHAPKWGPGGEMSYRTLDGERVNAKALTMAEMIGKKGSNRRAVDGTREKMGKKSNRQIARENGIPMAEITSGSSNGDTITQAAYLPPVLANPGVVVEASYSASEVAKMLQEHGDFRHHIVGGGVMGSKLAHASEAPFPESLVEFFVLSFAKPGGVVCDPFGGSFTTAAVAVRWKRRFLGCDIRQSQVDIGLKRLGQETPMMFV